MKEDASRMGILLFGGSAFPLAMPKWGSLKGGKEAENYWNSQLVESLHKIGLLSAGFERIFTVRKEGKEAQSKPDVSLANGGVHLVSGKFGARKELEAYRTADEYKEDIAPALRRIGERIGEVFAVTYPGSKGEKFHLHVLPREGHHELSFTLETLDEVAAQVKAAVDGLVAELTQRAEPVLDETKRLLRWGAEDLAQSLRGAKLAELEGIFGGHGFFQSVLQAKLHGEERIEALRLGAAYLFVNQVLFYVLLSHAAERAGQPDLHPRIKNEHYGSPKALRDEYFQKVRSKNYEPVYGFDVARFFSGPGAKEACEEVVRGVVGLAPKLDIPDLVGQVFQGLIPFAIRKPLGAHYTNPRAAKLLALLAIDRSEMHVLDPACGSGTLLVASYQRKSTLSSQTDRGKLHHKFVEEDITGIDAMAFAAHLAAVNLALQEPLLETDHVRIGTTDSTRLRPGDEVVPTEEALPTELQQGTLLDAYGVKRRRTAKGPVRMRDREARPIKLRKVDLVIMNPPFTSRDNMAKNYRDLVDRRFSDERYKKAISGKKISQQAYFLLLADRFLDEGGRIAAVLPLNTFVGYDYWPLIEFLLREYTVEYLIVGLGRPAFSEDTSLSECLLIASKKKPGTHATFRLVGTLKPPTIWEPDEPTLIADSVLAGQSLQDITLVREFPQTALSPKGNLLSDLLLRLIPEYDEARKALDQVVAHSLVPLVPFADWRANGVKYQDRIEPVRHLKTLGASALLAVRNEMRALKKIDRLVFQSHEAGLVTLRDRVGGAEYRFPASALQPSVRRMSYLSRIDISDEADFCVTDPGAALRKPMESMYGTKDAKKILAKLRMKGFWKKCCSDNSSRVLVARRVDLASPGTTLMSCWSSTPAFNTTNFAAKNFKDKRQEKLFCLWINSSLGLLQVVAATPTRGSWMGIQRNIVDKILLPNYSTLSEEVGQRIDQLWDRVNRMHLKSLVEQLEANDVFRTELDNGLFELIGIADAGLRNRLGTTIRLGIAAAIKTLKKSMGGGGTELEDGEAENSADGLNQPHAPNAAS
jgi:hypothetical protein